MTRVLDYRFGAAALLATTALLGGAAEGATAKPDPATVALGERIYREGIRTDGSLLVGTREDGVTLQGGQAACVACHRQSGLGSVEGTTWVPPITARALFGGAGTEVIVRTSRRFNAATSVPQAPRTASEVAELVRSGRKADGTALGSLMPRYNLSSKDESALLAYLGQLGRRPAPGITPDTIHLATVITPDVPAARKSALLRTLEVFTRTRNVSLFAGKRKRIPHAERLTHSRRQWQLHVWELTGSEATWPAQLAAKQADQPVFALLSGTSGSNWAAVSSFCEASRVACWFPSLDKTPDLAESEHYSIYFSAGVRTDAEVTAQALHAAGVQAIAMIGDGTPQAVEGLRLLGEEIRKTTGGIRVREISTAALKRRDRALADANEALVVFGGANLATTLGKHPAPHGPVWWAVGEDRKVRTSLPESWQTRLTLVDRFEQEPLREANLRRFRDWSRVVRLPLTDERVQAEAYFAANFLSGTLTDMLNNLQPEYLVERAQDTLSMREGETLQMQIQALMMGGGGGGHRPASSMKREAAATVQRRADDLELQRSRTSTSLYPRLSLGPNQNFASKGTYLVPPTGNARWVVPGRNESALFQSTPAAAQADAVTHPLSQGATP